MKLKINRKEFVDWYFDSDTIRSLGNEVYETLLENKKYTVTLDDIFKGVGYIPSHIVENLDEIKHLLTEQEIEDKTIEEPYGFVEDNKLKVKWV